MDNLFEASTTTENCVSSSSTVLQFLSLNRNTDTVGISKTTLPLSTTNYPRVYTNQQENPSPITKYSSKSGLSSSTSTVSTVTVTMKNNNMNNKYPYRSMRPMVPTVKLTATTPGTQRTLSEFHNRLDELVASPVPFEELDESQSGSSSTENSMFSMHTNNQRTMYPPSIYGAPVTYGSNGTKNQGLAYVPEHEETDDDTFTPQQPPSMIDTSNPHHENNGIINDPYVHYYGTDELPIHQEGHTPTNEGESIHSESISIENIIPQSNNDNDEVNRTEQQNSSVYTPFTTDTFGGSPMGITMARTLGIYPSSSLSTVPPTITTSIHPPASSAFASNVLPIENGERIPFSPSNVSSSTATTTTSTITNTNSNNDNLAKAVLENKPILELEPTIPITVPHHSTNIFPLASPYKPSLSVSGVYPFTTPSNDSKIKRHVVDDLQYTVDNSTIQGLTPGYPHNDHRYVRSINPADLTLSSLLPKEDEEQVEEGGEEGGEEEAKETNASILPVSSSTILPFSPGTPMTSKSIVTVDTPMNPSFATTTVPNEGTVTHHQHHNLSNVSFIPSAVKMVNENPFTNIPEDDNTSKVPSLPTGTTDLDTVPLSAVSRSSSLPVTHPSTVSSSSSSTTTAATNHIPLPRTNPVTTLTETFEERLKQADLDLTNTSTTTSLPTASTSLTVDHLNTPSVSSSSSSGTVFSTNGHTVSNKDYSNTPDTLPTPTVPSTLNNISTVNTANAINNVPKLAMIPLQISTSARTLSFVSSNLLPLLYDPTVNRWILTTVSPSSIPSSILTANLPVRNPSSIPLNLSLHIDIGTVTLTPYLNRSFISPSTTVAVLPSVTVGWTIETMNRCFQFTFPDNNGTMKPNNDRTILLLPSQKVTITVNSNVTNIVNELVQQSSVILQNLYSTVLNQYTALGNNVSSLPKGVPLGIIDIQYDTKVKIFCTLGTVSSSIEERSVFTIPIQGKIGCTLDRSNVTQTTGTLSSSGSTPSTLTTPRTTGFSGSPPSSIILPEFISQIKPNTSTAQHLPTQTHNNYGNNHHLTLPNNGTVVDTTTSNGSNTGTTNIEGGQGIFRKVKTNNHTGQTVSTALPNSYPNSRSSTPLHPMMQNAVGGGIDNPNNTYPSRSVSPALTTTVPSTAPVLPNHPVLTAPLTNTYPQGFARPPLPTTKPNTTNNHNPTVLPPAPMVQQPASMLSLSQQQQQQQQTNSTTIMKVPNTSASTNRASVVPHTTTTNVRSSSNPPVHPSVTSSTVSAKPITKPSDHPSVPRSNDQLNLSWTTNNSIDTEEISLAERYLLQRQQKTSGSKTVVPPTIQATVGAVLKQSSKSIRSTTARSTSRNRTMVPVMYDHDEEDERNNGDEEDDEHTDDQDPSASPSPYVVRSHGSTVHGFTVLKKKAGKRSNEDGSIAFEISKGTEKSIGDRYTGAQPTATLRSTRLPLSPFSPAKPVTKVSVKNAINNITKTLSPRTAAIIKSNYTNLTTNPTVTHSSTIPKNGAVPTGTTGGPIQRTKGPQRVPIIPPPALPESIYSNHYAHMDNDSSDNNHPDFDTYPKPSTITGSSTIPTAYTSVPPPSLPTRNKLSPLPAKRRPPFVTGTSTTHFNKVTSPSTKSTVPNNGSGVSTKNVPLSPPRVVPTMNKLRNTSNLSPPASPPRSMNNTLRHKTTNKNSSSVPGKGDVSSPLSSHTYHSMHPSNYVATAMMMTDNEDQTNLSYTMLNTSHTSHVTTGTMVSDTTASSVVLRTQVELSPNRQHRPTTRTITAGSMLHKPQNTESVKVSRSISPFPSVRDAATSPFVFGTVSFTGKDGEEKETIHRSSNGLPIQTVDTATSPLVVKDDSAYPNHNPDNSVGPHTVGFPSDYTLSTETIQQIATLPNEDEMNDYLRRSFQASSQSLSFPTTTVSPSVSTHTVSPHTLRRSIDAMLLKEEENRVTETNPSVAVPSTVSDSVPPVVLISQPVSQYSIFSPHRGEMKEQLRKEELLREVAQLERQSMEIMQLQQEQQQEASINPPPHYYYPSDVPTTVHEDENDEEENDEQGKETADEEPKLAVPSSSMEQYYSPIQETYSVTQNHIPSFASPFSPSTHVPKVSPFHLEHQFASPASSTISSVLPSPPPAVNSLTLSSIGPSNNHNHISSNSIGGSWYITTESSTVRFPALTNGPDNTPLTNKINIYNSSKEDIGIDIYGPDKEKLSYLTAANSLRFTSPTVPNATGSSSSPSLSLLSLYNQELPINVVSRRNTYINLRFSLPETGTRIKLHGYTYHNGTHSLSGILYLRSATDTMNNSSTAFEPSLDTSSSFDPTTTKSTLSGQDYQTVRIIVDRKVWEAYGYIYDNVSHTLVSTGLMGVGVEPDRTTTTTTTNGTNNPLFFTSPLPGSGPSNAIVTASSVKNNTTTATTNTLLSPSNPQMVTHPMNGYGPLGIGAGTTVTKNTLKPSPINLLAMSSTSAAAKTPHPSSSSFLNTTIASPSHEAINPLQSFSRVSVTSTTSTRTNTKGWNDNHGIMVMNAHPVEPKHYHEGSKTVHSKQQPVMMNHTNTTTNPSWSSTVTSTAVGTLDKPKATPIDKPMKKPTTFHPASPPLITDSTSAPKTTTNGIHVPLRTVYFPTITSKLLASVTSSSSSTLRIRIQICNTSTVPLSLTSDIRSIDSTSNNSNGNANSTLPFYIKTGHQQFILQPRSFVMLPIFCNLGVIMDQLRQEETTNSRPLYRNDPDTPLLVHTGMLILHGEPIEHSNKNNGNGDTNPLKLSCRAMVVAEVQPE